MSFFDGATLIGTATLDGSDVATFSAALGVGSHSVTGVYSGDANFNGNTSPVDTTTVEQASTTTALTAAPDPTVFGQPATFTATVTAVAPGAGTATGSVDFFDGAMLLGSGTLDESGVATFAATLDVGSHSVTATYNGDDNFTDSASPVDTTTVSQANTSVAVTAAADPSVFGQFGHVHGHRRARRPRRGIADLAP